jgi:hypothetical protein
LHPQICNVNPFASIDTWAAWVPLASSGVVDTADLANVQCREGHSPTARLCSKCIDGYWLDGLLCRRCFNGEAALVGIVSIAALGALVVYVWLQMRNFSVGAGEHCVTLLLWYFQVAGALQLSAQINAAENGHSDDTDNDPFRAVLPLLSFRPWAAECLLGGAWTFETGSLLLLLLPTVIVVATICARALWSSASARARVLFAGVLLLDMTYLPVAQRAIEWFNERRPAEMPDMVCLLRRACC